MVESFSKKGYENTAGVGERQGRHFLESTDNIDLNQMIHQYDRSEDAKFD